MMKTPAEILKDARSAKEKDSLGLHEQTIITLREKSYSWREIAKFLCERGIDTDHSKVFRFIQKTRKLKMDIRPEDVPTAERYVQTLSDMKAMKKITNLQLKMLAFHYRAHNRTTTYTQLANAAGYDAYRVANARYGGLEIELGNLLDMPLINNNDFYCSAIGTAIKFESEDPRLIMHHELAKALDTLDWFGKSSD